MFEPLDSPVSKMSLSEALDVLYGSGRVAGIALFGTTASGMNEASDYDILVVVDADPVPIRSGVTWIADRLADLVFASTPEIETFLNLSGTIQITDDWRGRQIAWLTAGDIVRDRDGLMIRVQQHLRQLPQRFDVPSRERYARWDHANYNLAQSTRYAKSSDHLYREAFELRMTYQLADAMVDYFRVRGLDWHGEKEALRYWSRHDPDFKRLLLECLRAVDVARKFDLYREVLARSLDPVGGVWPARSTSVTPSEGKSLEEAREFWMTLVGASPS